MKKQLLLQTLAMALGGQLAAQCVTPPPPTLVSATPNKICSISGGTTNLNATTTGAGINWYTVPSGGSPFGFSASASNYSVNAVTTTTYYAEAIALGGTITNTFSFTGNTQTFVVPAGVTTLQVEAWGAQGNFNANSVPGGLGGYAKGILTVTPGSTLFIEVGGGGSVTASGGYNGGGAAGSNTGCTQAVGGGGGGASDVRVGGIGLANRIIVGAGGGGAAGDRVSACGRGTGGGGGGGYYGGGGGAAWPQASLIVPLGGDQTTGGAGGTSAFTSVPGNNGSAGAFGIGGAGGVEVGSNQAGAQTASPGGVGGGTVGAIGVFAGNFTGQSGAGGSSFLGTLALASTTAGIRTGNGQVILTYQGTCANSTRIPVTVTVSPNPTVSVNNGTICSGSNFTLSPSGASTYTVQGGNLVVNPTTNSTYTVVGTNTAGCISNVVTSSINVNSNPTITANSGQICSGSNFTITPSGASTYTIQGGNAVVSPTATSIYTIVGTATNGCVGNTATSNVTVNTLPTISVNSGAVCSGNSFTIVPSGASTYTIQGGNTVVSPSVNTSYTVTGTSAQGCIGNVATSNVSIGITPTITVNSGAICVGNSFTLIPTGATTYTIQGGNTVVSPTATGAYTVSGSSAQGCIGNVATSNVTVNALPTVSASVASNSICANGGTIALIGSPTGGVFTGSNVANNVFTPGASLGNFIQTYAFTNTVTGCSNTASTSITVLNCTGINERLNSASGIEMYPNPTTGVLNVKCESLTNNEYVTITNALGQVILNEKLTTIISKINTLNLENGVYFIQVYSGNKVLSNQKIVKQ